MVIVRWFAFMLRFFRLMPRRSEQQAERDFVSRSMLGPEWLPPK